MDPISELMDGARANALALGRMLVTLSYAQSMDGCLTARRGEGMAISGEETRLLTHQLRAANDAILVGIGTVLADDPRLSARLAGGPHPQPVILDRRLRLPSEAALLQTKDRMPIVFCGEGVDPDRLHTLERSGVSIRPVPVRDDGFLDLSAVLVSLFQSGLLSLMVEGGARVLSSFLLSGLGDQAMITIAPFWAGGDGRIEFTGAGNGAYPNLRPNRIERFGRDWVVWGKIGEDCYATSSPVFHSPEPG